ncbi:hypothetical protein GCM10009794_22280 [Rothia terrae]
MGGTSRCRNHSSTGVCSIALRNPYCSHERWRYNPLGYCSHKHY